MQPLSPGVWELHGRLSPERESCRALREIPGSSWDDPGSFGVSANFDKLLVSYVLLARCPLALSRPGNRISRTISHKFVYVQLPTFLLPALLQ